MSFCSPGEAWRLEDDCTDPPRDPQLGTAVEDAPFSYFRTRSFYMRKSLSVDNHLGSLSYAVHPAETKAERVKTKLRRQFVSIGASGPSAFTHMQLPKNIDMSESYFYAQHYQNNSKRARSRLAEQMAAAARVCPHRGRAPACLAWQGFCLPASRRAGAGSEAAVAQPGDAQGECLVSGCFCPKYETNLKTGKEFSCPLPHLHKQLGLFEGLQRGAVRGWGERRASAETLRQLGPFWPFGASWWWDCGDTSGLRRSCGRLINV